MKLILGLVLLLSSTAFAGATSGTVLKKQVMKMGTCLGKYALEGTEVTFTSEKKTVYDQKANMLMMTFVPGAFAADAYTTDDAYAYTMAQVGQDVSVAYTPWKVTGSKVLVYVQGEWMSLTIGFKSKTCWF
jgi:hypothetical protein